MSDIINLRQFKKRKAQATKELEANANRILFGRTKAEKAFAKNLAFSVINILSVFMWCLFLNSFDSNSVRKNPLRYQISEPLLTENNAKIFGCSFICPPVFLFSISFSKLA